jgi:hypothetical protein
VSFLKWVETKQLSQAASRTNCHALLSGDVGDLTLQRRRNIDVTIGNVSNTLH